ncbi:MAG: ComF family protein [Tannerellaceae bacterium]|jgi:ComF family protein|nr:ComF family protein [Tannerellaceae bacterium]
MRKWIGKAITDLLNLFYPPVCLLCGSALANGEKQLCARCVCGLSYAGFRGVSDNPVAYLPVAGEKPVSATAYYRFEQGGGVQRLIHAVKYLGNKELGYLLGRWAALDLLASDEDLFRKAQLLVPVPLHPRKYRKRGYNQSEWIARGMASVLNIPVCTAAIQRNVMTESQTGKTAYNRWANVADVFSVSDPAQIMGKYVLLVDDVITTGATAGSCINVLSSVEGTQVGFFALSAALP